MAKDAEQQRKFRAEWEAAYGGTDNAHKNILLAGDVDFKPLGISPKDAQFIEWSAFSVPDVCRYYRVPPHMVMDLSRATFSNIEHQGIEYVNYTLMPWIVRWEQQIQMKLIDTDVTASITRAEQGKGRKYAKFNVNALLRGDFQSRMMGYASAIQNGIVNIDEVRALEDWNVLPGDSGKAHHIQLNMQTVPGTGTPTASEAAALAKIQTQPSEGVTNG
jgi:HK97 family phage portal protein